MKVDEVSLMYYKQFYFMFSTLKENPLLPVVFRQYIKYIVVICFEEEKDIHRNKNKRKRENSNELCNDDDDEYKN